MRHLSLYLSGRSIAGLLACLLSILLAFSSVAQPTVQWENYAGYAPTAEFAARTARLSNTRFVTVGSWRSANFTVLYPLLTFTKPNGDTIRQLRVQSLQDVGLSDVSVAENGDFTAVGGSTYDSIRARQIPHGIICRFDSLGNVKWCRYLSSGSSNLITRIIALPDGALIAGNVGVIIQGATSQRVEVRRIDGQGRTQWIRQFGRDSNAKDFAALSDGSYGLLTDDPNRFAPPHTLWDFDQRLIKLTTAGDSVTSVYVGDSAAIEIGNRLIATTDGGLALVGKQSVQPSSTPRRGVLFKLDANWSEQWRYSFAPTTGDYDRGGELYDVRELANGHFLVTGLERIRGQMNEVAAPGTALWTWTPPAAAGGIFPKGRELLPDTTTGDWRVVGYGSNQPLGMGNGDIWFASLANLPAAATVNLCAVPPGVPVATFQPLAARPDSLRFSLDRAATSAGPVYAEISRVTWQWGDGTPADTGRAVTHVFASTTPVRVRCTITNNLFCSRSLDLFPFGPVTGVGLPEDQAPLPAVSVFPNPSASGQFTVRVSGAAALPNLLVVDALGRSVWHRPAVRADTFLDLSTQAAGLYLLRLTWPDGRTVSQKLWRP